MRALATLVVHAIALFAVAMFAIATGAQQDPVPGTTFQDLLDGLKHPSRWLTYSGDYSGQRHSPLKQITPDERASSRPRSGRSRPGRRRAVAGSRRRRSCWTACST